MAGLVSGFDDRDGRPTIGTCNYRFEFLFMAATMSEPEFVEFRPFDPDAEVERFERSLPHWFQPGAAIFITFRTADSMPRAVLKRWHEQQEQWLIQHGYDPRLYEEEKFINQLKPEDRNSFLYLRGRMWHHSLDECHGECLLRRNDVAEIVAKAIHHFDGDRYVADSFVIMPNHVHLLVQFRSGGNLKAQTKSWLQFTAREINRKLGRRGPFWQSEPFDHIVRSAKQFAYLQGYIADNPKKAKLRVGEFIYWSRNA